MYVCRSARTSRGQNPRQTRPREVSESGRWGCARARSQQDGPSGVREREVSEMRLGCAVGGPPSGVRERDASGVAGESQD